MHGVTIGEIADFVGGQYNGVRHRVVIAVATLAEATADHLSFFSNSKYASQLANTKAGAILVPRDTKGDDERWIRVGDPYFAMAQVSTRWFGARPRPRGISSQAAIAKSAKLGNNLTIGAFATVGEDVIIGDNVTIFQSVSIEAGSKIGDDSVIYPNVVIYDGTLIGCRCIIHAGAVIGSDGYGFATHEGKHHKIPQIGIVRIEDDVEIGACSTVDRAAFGETIIGEGTKIDNLVQIGHNVRIGKHCLLVSHVGIAGSTELGDHVVAGGQAGIIGHLKIGHRAQITAKSAVFDDVPDDARVIGAPAIPLKEFVRRQAALRKLAQKKQEPR